MLTKNGLKNKNFIQDLKSTNGTLINNVRTEKDRRHQLKSGDILQFGKKQINQSGRKLSLPIIAWIEIIDKEFWLGLVIDGCNICHEAKKQHTMLQ